MDNNKNQLQEQEAPAKNHDNAFVKVGEDGAPVIPGQTTEPKTEDVSDDRITPAEEA